MKRTALTHTKMKRLQRQLGVPAYAAVGIMESLWNLTAKETPRGDIGKLTDEDIAMQLGWDGDPDQLIQALLASGWLDVDEDLRFIVHDWHEHADDSVDNALARSVLTYANGKMPRMRRLSVKERNELSTAYSQSVRTNAHEKPQKATESHEKPLPVASSQLPVASSQLPVASQVKKQQQAQAPFVLPNWIDRKAWDGYEEMRKKRPMTNHARSLAVKKLAKLAEQGHSPADVLNQSTLNAWTGLFEVKGNGNGSNQQNRRTDRIDAQIEALRRAGVSVPDRFSQAGPSEVCGSAGGCDGPGTTGVVLEGVV